MISGLPLSIQARYLSWLDFDESTTSELKSITSSAEIEDRFYRDLEFGTGGLRGVMGAGTNRMNRYTVRRATRGLADYLLAKYQKYSEPVVLSVAVAFDSRLNSADFAAQAAEVLCAAGIKTYLFDQIAPTPVLSFAVRHLGCHAGIVITASHNPKIYNGYKVYDAEGCQLIPHDADQVIAKVNAVTDYAAIPVLDLEKATQLNRLQPVGSEIMTAFLAAVRLQSHLPGQGAVHRFDDPQHVINGYRHASQTLLSHPIQPDQLKIVYTPLHGSGVVPVREILSPFATELVAAQAIPDGNFPTVRSPNPEEKDALALAIAQAQKSGAALVLGTDPDCDRVGAAVNHQGEFILLTGNQIGALLVDFVTLGQAYESDATLVKTIVTNDLGATIGRSRGLSVVNTLTGFKYIGDQINSYERTGEREFIVGYEESFGYLVGTHARDKDAVVAARLIAEMAAHWQAHGQTLIDRLNELYSTHGYFLDDLDSFTLSGKAGAEKIANLMVDFRVNSATLLPNIATVKDYSLGIDGLDKTDVLKFILADGSWIAIRPSGTEPKIKIYYSIRAKDQAAADVTLQSVKQLLHSRIGS
ncbi:MAG: phospho-sugar mutase [Eubacteriales bacterium]|nr:phospho-sugar mutase [Eubacteriales bacterium]